MPTSNTNIVVFGGTGDLMKRKLVPAFASLFNNGSINKSQCIIGVGRRDLTTEQYKNFLAEGFDKKRKEMISKMPICYFKADLDDTNFLNDLPKILSAKESNNLFYLATSYKLFPRIVQELKKKKLLNSNKDFWSRVVFEKPFGTDHNSFIKLGSDLHKTIKEDKIYRIDHYLAKETVQNILILKYANPLFNYILNGNFVDKVEIVVDEDLNVGNRLGYYHDIGAVKDMIQNHLLQVLSLMIMDIPKHLTAPEVHNQKVLALKNLKLSPAKEQLLGQYSSYQSEVSSQGLKKKNTETFARLSLISDSKRWKGTKFILRTGKKLERKYGQIKIIFKNPEDHKHKHLIGLKENKIVIDIYPKQDIRIILNSRKPGTMKEVLPVNFDFCQDCVFGPNTLDEYATLLAEVIKGEKTLFTRHDELNSAWNIIDQFEKIRSKVPFKIYKDGSNPEDN